MSHPDLPRTLGALRSSRFHELIESGRTLKEELRSNLMCKLDRGENLFPGVMGYEDTVIPQVVNAVLSRHNFILLGLRGQAKTRLARMLTRLLDPWMPYVAGCEIRDHPLQPICKQCRQRIAEMGDKTPIAWLASEQRYIEKLATPDVTIADMIGDIDPIKAARSGQDISDELTIHYGLIPRANRGLFAINELPDLAGKCKSACSTSCRRATFKLRATRCGCRWTSCWFHCESGGLHCSRQDHHAVEGPHRQRDSHALSR